MYFVWPYGILTIFDTSTLNKHQKLSRMYSTKFTPTTNVYSQTVVQLKKKNPVCILEQQNEQEHYSVSVFIKVVFAHVIFSSCFTRKQF